MSALLRSRSCQSAVNSAGISTRRTSSARAFNDVDPSGLLPFLCEEMNVEPNAEVTRIEWRYLSLIATAGLA